ncbi:MAG: hypothetical protein H7Z12_12835 [Rhodospirillaceae bacterium]|nr:hypothetical protein [Rhodospirillales bacterium]
MKTLFAAAALVALVANPVLAQTAVEAITGAAKDAAVQATTDSISKAAGGKKSEKDAKGKRDKDGPNWGKSDDRRQDGDHGHKGKKKNRD